MSDHPPIAHPPKLPLWQTISLSYHEYFSGFGDVLRISWVWLAALTALVYLATWLQYSWIAAAITDLKMSVPEGPTPMPVPPMAPISNASFLILLAANLLIIVAALSIAVAWHRHVILGEAARSSTENIFTILPWSYASALVLILLAVSVPVALLATALLWVFLQHSAGFGSSLSPVMMLISLFDAVALAALIRLSILLPARAIGNASMTFKDAWHATSGNTVRLAWGLFITGVVPVMLAQVGAAALWTPAAGDLLDLDKSQIVGLAERMAAVNSAGIALTLLVLPISAGFLSHAYRYFVGPQELPSS